MAVSTITINSTDITSYLAQEVGQGFEYRSSGEGFVANGQHYQNIIAKKEILTLKFKPLSLTDYATIRNVFESTDEYAITIGTGTSKNYYRKNDFKGTNLGDMYIKDITIELREI